MSDVDGGGCCGGGAVKYSVAPGVMGCTEACAAEEVVPGISGTS